MYCVRSLRSYYNGALCKEGPYEWRTEYENGGQCADDSFNSWKIDLVQKLVVDAQQMTDRTHWAGMKRCFQLRSSWAVNRLTTEYGDGRWWAIVDISIQYYDIKIIPQYVCRYIVYFNLNLSHVCNMLQCICTYFMGSNCSNYCTIKW